MTELVRVSRGVWRPPSTVADLRGRAAALLSAAPEGSAVAGRSAALLHGIWLPSDHVGRIDLILRAGVDVPQRHPGSRRREVRGRRQNVHPDDVVTVATVPTTSLARTWVDLAAQLTMPDLVAAGDSVLRLGATVAELSAAVRRAAHRPGVVQARRALPLLDRRSRSRPESHLRYAVVNAGLPTPEVNEPIHTDGEWLAEPDLSYDDVRLALEYNGADHAETARMRRDITREVDVEFRGRWRVITFGPAQVFGRPDEVALHVRRARRDQAFLLGRHITR